MESAVEGFTGRAGTEGEAGDEFAGATSVEGEVGDVGELAPPETPALGDSTLNDTFDASGRVRSVAAGFGDGLSKDAEAAPALPPRSPEAESESSRRTVEFAAVLGNAVSGNGESADWGLAGNFRSGTGTVGKASPLPRGGRGGLTVSPASLTVVDDAGNRLFPGGKYTLYVGTSQPDARSRALTGASPVKVELQL